MSKFSKCIITILVVCFMSLSLSFACFASSVTYQGNSKDFVFSTNSKENPTDLFENFKDVMPGDSITQSIVVKNDVSNETKIKLYIRSNGADENSKKLLSQMNLTVKERDDSVMFDAPADTNTGMADWVYVGTIYSGGEVYLDLTLDVSKDMGNEFQSSVGNIEWQFKVDELPVEPDDPVSPVTGYRNYVLLVLAGILLCSAFLFFVIIPARRKKSY